MPFHAPAVPGESGEPGTTPAPATAAPTQPRRSRRPLVVGALAAALVVTGGTVAVAGAHKTVTLDVDGAITQVSTFAGSVDGVLGEQSVDVGTRDAVTPSVDSALASGDEIVIRRARQVVVEADGEQDHVWTTALDAEEALASLEARGTDVRLVASRSGARADLAVRLGATGPVDVVVDGTTHEVVAGATELPDLLASLEVTLSDLDRVAIDRVAGADGERVTVIVQRVVAEEQSTVTEVPFETVTRSTDELYRGQSDVAQEGTPGEHTTVHRVVLVDGVEESRRVLSEGVTTEPVAKIVRQGTKERPRPAPQPVARSGGSGGSGSAAAAPAPAPAVGGDVWARLAQCESGGNPSIVSRNGLYHGLYQFSVATWQSVGGAGLPSQASPAEQTERAQILQARSGWGQWPACSRKLGLR